MALDPTGELQRKASELTEIGPDPTDTEEIEDAAAKVRRKLSAKKKKAKAAKKVEKTEPEKAPKKKAPRKKAQSKAKVEPGSASDQLRRRRTTAGAKAAEAKVEPKKRKVRENRKAIGLDEPLEIRMPANSDDTVAKLLATMETMRAILDYAEGLELVNKAAVRRVRERVERGELPAGLARMQAGNAIRGALRRQIKARAEKREKSA